MGSRQEPDDAPVNASGLWLVAYRLRGHSNVVGALLSNGLAAGSSLVLQLVATRTLGARGLGQFSLLLSVLITFNAVQSGWIGDSLTVLDRFEPATRTALIRSQEVCVGLALVVGFGGAAATGATSPTVALVFGMAMVLWVLEETCRRILMARLEFWRVVASEAVYAVAALGVLAVSALTGHAVTVGTLVLAIAVGAGGGLLTAMRQLPSVELLPPRPWAAPALRRLSAFASWRAAQIGVRPAAQLLMRVIVTAFLSASALGRLEAGRLLLAPVLVVINGAGFLLLPMYTEDFRQGRFQVRRVRKAMLVLVSLSMAAGAVALVTSPWLSPLLTGGSFRIQPLAIFSWTLLVAGFGAGIPAGIAIVASHRSRDGFVIRAAESCLGLVIVLVVASAGVPELAPAGLAVGTFFGAAWLYWSLSDSPGQTPEPAT